jgi:hypothetical protein
MTTATRPRRTAAATPVAGVHRTPAHLYYFNGQGPWPGVTTVTDVLDKPALVRWKVEQVALAALENAERLVDDRDSGRGEAAVKYLTTGNTAARDRGSRIHQALEHVLRRATNVPVDDRDQPAVNGARLWLNEHHVKPLEVEAFLINETVGYGGTCDLIAEIDGEVWLLDWKTSKSVAWPSGQVYDEMRLQLAAYSRAEFIAKVADPERYEVPAIERFGILHVTDGGTRLYEADVTEADWTTFRACLWIHGWRKGKAAA